MIWAEFSYAVNRVWQKFYDSLVLRTTIRKKLVVRSSKGPVLCVLNNKKEIKLTENVLCLGSAVFQSTGRGTEINLNALSCKGFHGCHARKEIMASKRWHLWNCLAFFCKVRTSMFLSIDKFISWQRLVPVFPCFIICGQREVCLTLGSLPVLVPRRKCACPSDKDLLVQIKFS